MLAPPGRVDRGRTGSKHHLITAATGIPLAATLSGGNRNDVTQLIPLLQAVPPVRGKRGRPRCRPDIVLGDRGYDHDKYRRLAGDLGVKPVIAHRGTERLRTWHPTLGRRAHIRPPALVPPPADPLGDPRRHPRSLPHPRMRTDLLETPELIRIEVLSPARLVAAVHELRARQGGGQRRPCERRSPRPR